MKTLELPKTFDEFVDARKNSFMHVKEFVENGGHLVGFLCSYTPLEVIEAAGAAAVGLCGTSNEPIADAEKVLVGHEGSGPSRVDKAFVAVGPCSPDGQSGLLADLVPVVPKSTVDVKK